VIVAPPFGQADLSNCEQELIHLAGSVQPHGALFTLRLPQLVIEQVSTNVAEVVGLAPDELLGRPLASLGEGCERRLQELLAKPANGAMPLRFDCVVGGRRRAFEGAAHRVGSSWLVLELEPNGPSPVETVDLDGPTIFAHLTGELERLTAAATIDRLADATVRTFRGLVGYDRVMVYRFDPDGHGQIIAESRDPRLDSLLGHHYPSTDIPQRARELYIRNKLRVLVDVNYHAAPLFPARLPGSGEELDMSLCYLRSMSPLHIQYLKNMGVTATLVASLIRDGKLWGLVACHHYSPRNLRLPVRAAAELLAEVVSTRVSAIESYAHTQVAMQVRRLEQRLTEATSTEGDWRMALLRSPRTLLQPLNASGAALFYDGEVLTTGEVPSSPELRALLSWVEEQPSSEIYSTASIATANPQLQSLTPTASGVVAAKLSTNRPDYLMWFRREQLDTVTWAGNPAKPMINDDPRELSPRRSFAAWTEIVRGTAVRWSEAELALAGAFAGALIDIIAQVDAVRLLIAESQLDQVRQKVAHAKEPIAVMDARGRISFASTMVTAEYGPRAGQVGQDIAEIFADPQELRAILATVFREPQSWRGERLVRRASGELAPVIVRIEVVPGRDRSVIGAFMILRDVTHSHQTAVARRALEDSLSEVLQGVGRERTLDGTTDLVRSILATASLAAMDVAEAGPSTPVAPVLRELQDSTRRATELCWLIKELTLAN
jgi:chemotaxis family two-component system sensor kinase Cph1